MIEYPLLLDRSWVPVVCALFFMVPAALLARGVGLAVDEKHCLVRVRRSKLPTSVCAAVTTTAAANASTTTATTARLTAEGLSILLDSGVVEILWILVHPMMTQKIVALASLVGVSW